MYIQQFPAKNNDVLFPTYYASSKKPFLWDPKQTCPHLPELGPMPLPKLSTGEKNGTNHLKG